MPQQLLRFKFVYKVRVVKQERMQSLTPSSLNLYFIQVYTIHITTPSRMHITHVAPDRP